ncbi:MAG: thioredoxin-dependent thiol peroxidase [Bacteroidetes bacterium]|nr:thioredoxin-dependent thiol peroxidase [Bacteroidota bacterium]
MPETVTIPEIGQQAPLFDGQTQDGDTIRLEDYRGRKVALYFYPKDDTPGCTRQACNLRDNYQTLLDAGIAVLGVSPDDVASHEKFAGKYELPFPLIADPQHTILEAYGVWGEKNLYGRTFMGVKRTTFLLDEEGVIRHVFKRPKVQEHTAEIMAAFEAVRA